MGAHALTVYTAVYERALGGEADRLHILPWTAAHLACTGESAFRDNAESKVISGLLPA